MMLQTTLFLSSPGTPNDILLSLFKLFFIFGSGFYVLVSFVIVRQIHVMKNTLITSFSPVIRTVGYLHLILAVSLLLFYVTVL